jgi:hypothetical protein
VPTVASTDRFMVGTAPLPTLRIELLRIGDVHRITSPVVAFRIATVPIQSPPGHMPMEAPMPGNRNIMYLIIGALIVAVGVLGYNLYQTKKEPEGLQINVGPNGLKIQNK